MNTNERKLVMSKTQVVGTMSEWSGIIRDMFRQFDDGSLTLAHAKAFIEHRDPFAITDIRQEWAEFYRKYFRMLVDFTDVQIPDNPSDFDRVIFVPRGLTLHAVIKVMHKHFSVSIYIDDLYTYVTDNVRATDKSYAIRLRERVEADEELKNISANQLKDKDINVITLLERLVYGFKYWSETVRHLDIHNWTLCASSRDSDGRVPDVHWDSDSSRLHVDWNHPDYSDDNLRTRRVVS